VVKLVVLYKKPADIQAFEKHYNEIHAPLAKKMPDLRKLEISHMTGSPGGEPKFYMIAELYFDNQAAMTAALSSSEGKAAAKDVMSFAGDLIHMMFADVKE
jgi:uncharacterized protein (TIGR02118 family)